MKRLVFGAFLSLTSLLTLPVVSLADDHHGHGDSHGHGDYHGHSGYSGRGYYGRPYYYGGYRRPYYYGGYGRPYWGPSLGFSYYTSPGYYSSYDYADSPTYETRTVYRSAPAYSPSDSLSYDVQRKLSRKGYYFGAIDGQIGAGSRAAIRSYQYDHGLTVTGRIDGALLRSLGIS